MLSDFRNMTTSSFVRLRSLSSAAVRRARSWRSSSVICVLRGESVASPSAGFERSCSCFALLASRPSTGIASRPSLPAEFGVSRRAGRFSWYLGEWSGSSSGLAATGASIARPDCPELGAAAGSIPPPPPAALSAPLLPPPLPPLLPPLPAELPAQSCASTVPKPPCTRPWTRTIRGSLRR